MHLSLCIVTRGERNQPVILMRKNEIESWMKMILVKELEIFLKIMKKTSSLTPENQKRAKDWYLGQFVDLFVIIASLCYKTHPEVIESVYQSIIDALLKFKDTIEPYSEPISIVYMLERFEKQFLEES